MPLPLSPAPPCTCLSPSLGVSLLPSWDAGYPPSLSFFLEVRLATKLPFHQKMSPLPPTILLLLLVLYLVLVGRIKGNLCHLGAFLSHLLHRPVVLLDELEKGWLRSIPCCCPLAEWGFVFKPMEQREGQSGRGCLGKSLSTRKNNLLGESGLYPGHTLLIKHWGTLYPLRPDTLAMGRVSWSALKSARLQRPAIPARINQVSELLANVFPREKE